MCMVDVIWGVGHDDSLGNKVKITILASGFDITIREGEKIVIGGNQPEFDFGGARTKKGKQGESRKSKNATATVTPQNATTDLKLPAQNSIDDTRLTEEYGQRKIKDLTSNKDRSSAIILALNQLDDDAICDILEKYPTYKRDRSIIDNIRTGAYDTGHQSLPSSTGSGQTFSYFGENH